MHIGLLPGLSADEGLAIGATESIVGPGLLRYRCTFLGAQRRLDVALDTVLLSLLFP